MMSQWKSYKPIWPETVIFWGAGATRALNMHTTDELGQAIYCLAQDKSLQERVSSAFGLAGISECVGDLLLILGDDESSAAAFPSSVQQAALQRQFCNLTAEKLIQRGRELRYTYDWGTLKQLVHICPGHNASSFRLQDLFNLLDMHIVSRHGFHVYGSQGAQPRFVTPESLVLARNALIMLIGLLHFHAYHKTLLQEMAVYQQYIGFAEILAKLMQAEGQCFFSAGHSLNDRRFYLFSYAVVHMNWDTILLWLIFNAHRKLNHTGDCLLIDNPTVYLELFHDLSYFMGIRRVDSCEPNIWYPHNESVVQQVNDSSQSSSRRVRIGKFYFPHGCSGWRECPSCGKVTMYLGNQWGYHSPSLFVPPLLPRLSEDWHQPRSIEEADAYFQGQADAVQCAYCGTLTELRHTPLVMQSSFKGHHPPFLEEIQRDMRICLEKAEHIVMFGYTLPPDDVIYRGLLSARQKRDKGHGPYCSVVVGQRADAPDCWLYGDELTDYLHQEPVQNSDFAKAITTARELFGAERVRGYAGGIPQVFTDCHSGLASQDKVLDLLYPKQCYYQPIIRDKA